MEQSKFIAKKKFGVDKESVRCISLSELSSLEEFGYKLVQCFEKYIGTFGDQSLGHGYSIILRQLPKFLTAEDCHHLDGRVFYDSLFQLRKYWYTNQDVTHSSLTTRNNNWDQFKSFIEFCIQEDVVPNIVVPSGNSKLHNRMQLNESRINNLIKSDNPVDTTGAIPFLLHRTDDEYLDELHESFIALRESFLKAARAEIQEIYDAYEKGVELSESVDWNNLHDIILSAERKGETPSQLIMSKATKNGNTFKVNRRSALFSRSNPQHVANILCYIKNKYKGIYYGRNRCGIEEESNVHLLKQTAGRPNVEKYSHEVISNDSLRGYLGQMTTRKYVPFFVLLLLKHPKLRVSSLFNLEVEDKYGNEDFIYTIGDSGELSRIRIFKNRASSTKHEILDCESIKALEFIRKITSGYRETLKKKGSKKHKYLFLKVNGGDSYGYPTVLNKDSLRICFGSKTAHQLLNNPESLEYLDSQGGLIRTTKLSFLYLHQDLHKYAEKINLRMLPKIGGIIKWFETSGDSEAASKYLGNSVKMTMSHYIPYPIQLLMNERVIRQFQNLLICSATYNKSCMLKATDFHTIDQVHEFLSQMLKGGSESSSQDMDYIYSSISQLLSKNKDVKDNMEIAKFISNNEIKIVINEDYLSVLFAYEDYLKENEYHISKEIQNENIAYFWLNLSLLLKSILKSSNISRELKGYYKSALSNYKNLNIEFRGL